MVEEVVADKGYHSRTTVHDLEMLEIRTYISEPDRGPQSWTAQHTERDTVYANRRRIRGARGKRPRGFVACLPVVLEPHVRVTHATELQGPMGPGVFARMWRTTQREWALMTTREKQDARSRASVER